MLPTALNSPRCLSVERKNARDYTRSVQCLLMHLCVICKNRGTADSAFKHSCLAAPEAKMLPCLRSAFPALLSSDTLVLGWNSHVRKLALELSSPVLCECSGFRERDEAERWAQLEAIDEHQVRPLPMVKQRKTRLLADIRTLPLPNS
jgi:hypothetical protein